MNKKELVEELAKKTGMTKKAAGEALDGLVEVISSAVAAKKPVVITGFGKFEARTRKASVRRNPQTGKKISVPAKVVPAFKAGKLLKERVAKKKR